MIRLSSRSSGEAPTGGVTPPFTDTPPGGGFTGVVTSTVVVVTVLAVAVAVGDVGTLATDLELNVQVEESKSI